MGYCITKSNKVITFASPKVKLKYPVVKPGIEHTFGKA
jgi:hypothetical protein